MTKKQNNFGFVERSLIEFDNTGVTIIVEFHEDEKGELTVPTLASKPLSFEEKEAVLDNPYLMGDWELNSEVSAEMDEYTALDHLFC